LMIVPRQISPTIHQRSALNFFIDNPNPKLLRREVEAG
jgi:hypothetical protein